MAVAAFFLLNIAGCKPREAKPEKQNEKPVAAAKISKEHNHTVRSEKAACPICNIRLFMEKGYREISYDELSKLQKSTDIFILANTLPAYFYRKEHIINSISMPNEDMEAIAPKAIKPEVKIVVYCKDFNCQVSAEAAEKLVKLGYKNIYVYTGGMKEWKEKGNPVSGLKQAESNESIYGPSTPAEEIKQSTP